MGSEIVPYQPQQLMQPTEFDMLVRLARVFADPQVMPKHFKNEAHVLSAMVVARDLGLPYSTPLRGKLYVVNGLVTCDGQLMMAMVQKSGKIKVNIEEGPEDGGWVEVTMKRPEMDLELTVRWDEEMVRQTKANMGPKGEKYTWKTYRQTMKRWRAISECARIVAADIILGMYLPDEIDQASISDGESLSIDIDTIADPDSAEAHYDDMLSPKQMQAFRKRLQGFGLDEEECNDAIGFFDTDTLTVLQAMNLQKYYEMWLVIESMPHLSDEDKHGAWGTAEDMMNSAVAERHIVDYSEFHHDLMEEITDGEYEEIEIDAETGEVVEPG